MLWMGTQALHSCTKHFTTWAFFPDPVSVFHKMTKRCPSEANMYWQKYEIAKHLIS